MGTKENGIKSSGKMKITRWHWAILILGLVMIIGGVIFVIMT
jgi:hypothetical protein